MRNGWHHHLGMLSDSSTGLDKDDNQYDKFLGEDNDNFSNVDNGEEKEEDMNETIDSKSNKDPCRGMFDDPYFQGEGDETTFKISQVFRDVNVLRAILRDYEVKGGYEIIKIKNDNLRADKCSTNVTIRKPNCYRR